MGASVQVIRTAAPETPLLTAAELRERLGAGTEFATATADALIAAATEQLDGYRGWLGRALITQSWRLVLPGFFVNQQPYNVSALLSRDGRIKIPVPPLQKITAVKYTDTAGVVQTLDPAAYRKIDGSIFATLIPLEGTSWPATRPQDDAVTIEFVAGYGDSGSDVPESLRNAVVLQASHLRSLMARNLFLASDQVEGVGEKRFVVGPGAGDAIDAAVRALCGNHRVTL
jgi:uncharacterized phiE125 gp8 family phage protein